MSEDPVATFITSMTLAQMEQWAKQQAINAALEKYCTPPATEQ